MVWRGEGTRRSGGEEGKSAQSVGEDVLGVGQGEDGGYRGEG
jgi:hypothetical protein